MNRRALTSLLLLPAFVTIPVDRLLGQAHDTEESFVVEAYNPVESVGKTYVCPSGVPVGTRAAEFKGTITTDSESGVTYQVLIRYGGGASAGESGGALR